MATTTRTNGSRRPAKGSRRPAKGSRRPATERSGWFLGSISLCSATRTLKPESSGVIMAGLPVRLTHEVAYAVFTPAPLRAMATAPKSRRAMPGRDTSGPRARAAPALPKQVSGLYSANVFIQAYGAWTSGARGSLAGSVPTPAKFAGPLVSRPLEVHPFSSCTACAAAGAA